MSTTDTKPQVVELVYTCALEAYAERLVGSSPTLRTNDYNMIPYELVKIYRDEGINLSGFNSIDYIGECWDYSSYDSFIYKAF